MKNSNTFTIILMNIALYIVGICSIAMLLTITYSVEPTLKNDNWFIPIITISWGMFCFFKTYLTIKEQK